MKTTFINANGSKHQSKHSPTIKLLPILLIVCGVLAFYFLGLDHYIAYHHHWTKFTHEHSILTPMLYIILYITVVALSIPGAALMTTVGGILFGAYWGTLLVTFAATTGATILFFVAKSSFGDGLREKAGPWLEYMADGFKQDAFKYLLILRLIPFVPFFVVNLVPAFLGVKGRDFVLATFIGIIPGVYAFALLGASVDNMAENKSIEIKKALNPQVVICLFGLALLSSIPVIYKKIKQTV